MPVQTPDIEIGDAYHAAVVHQMHRSLRGYGWITGDAATAGPGVAVTVPSDTSMWIDGNEVDVSSGDNSAQLLPHDRWPRWASIVVNDAGEVEALHSEADRPATIPDTDEELTGRTAPRPAPPIVTDASRALHSLVWIPANASAIESAHIVDRRIDARVEAYNFDLTGYSDADAVAAVQSVQSLNLDHELDVDEAATFHGPITANNADGHEFHHFRLTGSKTSGLDDNDHPMIYQTGNAGTTTHPRLGDLNILPRTSIDAAIRFLTGSPTPTIALQIDPDQSVTMTGDVSIGGTASHNSGETLSSHVWVNNNAVQNGESEQVEIQLDGTDGQGVLNFKTSN